MRVGIAADHGGFDLKEQVARSLREAGYEAGKKPGRNSMRSSRRKLEGGILRRRDGQAISVRGVRLLLREVF
jgi:hypothetical protein